MLSSIDIQYNSLPRRRTECTPNAIGAVMLTLLGSRAVSDREVKFRLRIKEGLTEGDLNHSVFPSNEISLKAELG